MSYEDTHTDKELYQCIQCDMYFSENSELLIHMSTQCKQSEKDFSNHTTILDNQSQPIYECSKPDNGFSDNCDSMHQRLRAEIKNGGQMTK